MMHGRLGAMHVLGLPGNPVSAYVCAVLFLVPLIRRLRRPRRRRAGAETAALGCDLPANDERADYLRATLARARRRPGRDPAPVQDSSMLDPSPRPIACCRAPPHAPRPSRRARVIRLLASVSTPGRQPIPIFKRVLPAAILHPN